MRVFRIGISVAALLSLVNCSTLASDGKRIDYGAAASKVPALEMPPDLTMPEADERYRIPEDTGNVATFSGYSRSGAAKADGTKNLLPDIPGVRLERNGSQRWLVVNKRAEDVWPIVEAFWQDNGLKIKTEDRPTGVMETDWAENLVRLPQPTAKNEGGGANNYGTYSIGERDQYVARLERSQDGAATDIHITHHGMEEVLSDERKGPTWQARGSDPEKEAIMLQRLMVRLGSSQDRAADELAMSQGAALAASAVPAGTNAMSAHVEGSSSELAGTSSLRELPSGNTVIVMNEPFDRSWRKVGLALDSAGLGVEDKDRERGVYYLRPITLEATWMDKLMFWRNKQDTSRHYRVYVKDGGPTCEVSITDQNGGMTKAGKEMLEAIFKYINKP